ncbi:UDP-N-acetylglucosamine 1-carboxyvinyltransferase [Alicyclobacillus sp. SO9]|uniref:UDP-N-acetylglucosamine 1-carboxyvinyltransferase n=1 Tax=Alicyclobacillus sp. SO9 TaxID=2665646 RepID=UPI0018E770FE|nr:UDP-N-acetylglucosamine 1-carboxyvinyltransferase [Alicyclobacillus sp. SO9]QQE80706.1 UDP-N-acetylglucosamine 1-carboxyvinyltransferase [Alicyclobacillus sp. SO9]
MDVLEIRGGRPLEGTTRVYGAKNAALPILAATVMTEGTCELFEVPNLEDIHVMLDILRHLGAGVKRLGQTLYIDASHITKTDVPLHLMRKMRSSIFLMGPLLARFGEVTVSKPGGCVIGQRPIDYHLRGMRLLGAVIQEQHGTVNCVSNRLKGTSITLDFPSVGATENLIMAAVLADGETVLENVAREPEVVDLANFLKTCGAQIEGAGEDTIRIRGVHHLKGSTYRVIPDRIVTGTWMIAAAATQGSIHIEGCEPLHLGALISKLRDAGTKIDIDGDQMWVRGPKQLKAAEIRTAPYPGFPTDLQAPMMALMAAAHGSTFIREDVFEARFKHVGELIRMGADIRVDGRTSLIRGVEQLSGAEVEATDLRGGAALVVAGLLAEGTTKIHGLHHLDRGYQQLDTYLRDLQADIRRVESEEAGMSMP